MSPTAKPGESDILAADGVEGPFPVRANRDAFRFTAALVLRWKLLGEEDAVAERTMPRCRGVCCIVVLLFVVRCYMSTRKTREK